MQMPDAKARRTTTTGSSEERGAALILSLMILTLLVILVFQMSYTTKIDLRLAKNRLDTAVLHYASEGVMTRASAYIEADARENEWDAQGDLWETASFAADEGDGMEDYDYSADPWGDEDAEQESQIDLEVIIIDEERKLNIGMLAEPREQSRAEERAQDRQNRRRNRGEQNQDNNNAQGEEPRNRAADEKLREQVFEGLISILVDFRDGTSFDLTGTEARRIAEAIRDYVTAAPTNDAGEEDIPKPETVDAPILSVDELLLVEGITEDLLFDFLDPEDDTIVIPGLLNFVTIWSSGLVNINTAPEEVLRALFDKDRRDEAESILEYRDEYEEDDEGGLFGGGDDGDSGERDSDDRIRDRNSASEEADTPGIFKETGELQSNRVLDNEDYNKILPLITTQSTVFSVHVIAKRGKMQRYTRGVFRRVSGQVYPVLYERRKSMMLYGRDLEEEDEEGGFLF